jgi:hypothetical protein
MSTLQPEPVDLRSLYNELGAKPKLGQPVSNDAGNGSDGHSVVDYAVDVGRGVAHGVAGFGESILDLGADIGNAAIGGIEAAGWNEDGGFRFKAPDLNDDFAPQTWMGQLTSGITQFATGYIVSGGLLAGASKLAGAAKFAGLSKALNFSKAAGRNTILTGFVKGGVADAISFTEHEGRLSNLIESFPALSNPITDYLSADPEDGWAEGRFKNVIEGMGLGGLTEALFKSVRTLRGMKNAATPEAARAIQLEAEPEIRAAVERLQQDGGRFVVESPEHLEVALKNFTTMSDEQVQGSLALLKTQASSLGMTFTEYVARRFPDVRVNQALEQDALLRGGFDTDAALREEPDGEMLAKLLRPEEKARIKSSETYKNVIKVYREMDEVTDQFLAAADAGAAGGGNYEIAAATFRRLFGDEFTEAWANMNAAFSTRTSVSKHMAASIGVLAEWISAGKPRDEASILKLIKKVNKEISSGSMGAQDKKIVAVLQNPTKIPDTLNLGGTAIAAKTDQFTRASLASDDMALTLDRHMARLLPDSVLDNAKSLSDLTPAQRKALTPAQKNMAKFEWLSQNTANYTGVMMKWREIAQKLSLPAYEVQERAWSTVLSLLAIRRSLPTASTDEIIGTLSDDIVEQAWDMLSIFTEDPRVASQLSKLGIDPATVKAVTGDVRSRIEASKGPQAWAGQYDSQGLRGVVEGGAGSEVTGRMGGGQHIDLDGSNTPTPPLGTADHTAANRARLTANPDEATVALGEGSKSPYAVLTASDPGNVAKSASENGIANAKLKAALERRGFKPKEIRGGYRGKNKLITESDGFLVPGLQPDEAMQFAIEAGQESILTHKGLLYADGKFVPSTGVKRHAPDGVLPDNYTRMELDDAADPEALGTDFIFETELDFSKETNVGPQRGPITLARTSVKSPLTKLAKGGKLKVYHYTFSGGTPKGGMKIDPKRFGKNPHTRGDLSGPKRSYYYVDAKKREPFFQDGTLYEAEVDASRVYDLNMDPDGLKDAARAENGGILNVDNLLDDISRSKTYDGIYYQSSDGLGVVAMFKPVDGVLADGGGKAMSRQGADEAVTGATTLHEDGSTTLYLFTKAFTDKHGRAYKPTDAVTILHEFGHVFRRDLGPQELAAVERALGIKDGIWLRDHEEEWAYQFEKWIADGQSIPGLEPLFVRWKDWMDDYYTEFGNSKMAGEITPEVQGVFDGMFGHRGAPRFLSDHQQDELGTRLATALKSGQPAAEAVSEVGVNLTKWDVNTEAKIVVDELSGVVQRQLRANGAGIGDVQTHAMVMEMADEIGARPDELARSLADRAISAETLAAEVVAGKMALAGLSERIVQVATRLSKAPDDAMRAQFLLLSDKMADLYTHLVATQRSAARATAAGRLRVGPLSEELIDQIVSTRGGRGKIDGVIRDIAAAGTNPKALRKILRKGKVWSALMEYRINALLSSPKTFFVNLISTALHTALLPSERMIGGVLSMNPMAIREGAALWMGYASALSDSWKWAKASMRVGDSILDPGLRSVDMTGNSITSQAFGVDGSIFGNFVDYLGTGVRLPTRIMTATDEFFKQMTYRSYVNQHVTRQGLDRGLKGVELARYLDEELEAAFDAQGRGISTPALDYAREATFTTPLTEGIAKNVSQMVNEHPSLRLIMPFVRTPTNIFRGVLGRSLGSLTVVPGLGNIVATINPVLKNLQADFRAGGVRKSTAVGKMATGGAMYATAMIMTQKGLLTGGGPSDPQQRNVLRATGWQPYSFVRMGSDGTKKYVQYNRLDPFGLFLGLAADFGTVGGYLPEDKRDELATVMIASVIKNFSSKTYLTGLIDLMEAIENPDRRAQQFLSSLSGSFAPRVLSHMVPDEYYREARTIRDGFDKMIPYFRDRLSPKRNVFGEKIEVNGAWGPDTLSPFAQTENRNDPVADEMASLQHGFSMPSPSVYGINLLDASEGTGTDYYDELLETTGSITLNGKTLKQALAGLISDPRYQALPETDDGMEPTGRVALVQNTMRRYRGAARRQLLRKHDSLVQLVLDKRRKDAGGRRPIERQE